MVILILKNKTNIFYETVWWACRIDDSGVKSTNKSDRNLKNLYLAHSGLHNNASCVMC